MKLYDKKHKRLIEIKKEAKRVLQKGGYLFITFPWISPLRRLKIFLRMYPLISSFRARSPIKSGMKSHKPSDFYQFFLTQKSVVKNVEKYGFKLVKSEGYDAIKGIKDEVSVLRPFLQISYNRKDIVSRSLRYIFSFFLKGVAGHMRICVFKKV